MHNGLFKEHATGFIENVLFKTSVLPQVCYFNAAANILLQIYEQVLNFVGLNF